MPSVFESFGEAISIKTPNDHHNYNPLSKNDLNSQSPLVLKHSNTIPFTHQSTISKDNYTTNDVSNNNTPQNLKK
jgi:hypothetical protein